MKTLGNISVVSVLGAAGVLWITSVGSRGKEQATSLLILALILGIAWFAKRVRWGRPKADFEETDRIPKISKPDPCPACGKELGQGSTRCWSTGCAYVRPAPAAAPRA